MAAPAPQMPNARQVRLAAALFAVIAGLLALFYYLYLAGDYGVLASGIRPEQAAAIVEQLKKDGTDYKLEDGGTTILVPQAKLDGAKLEVASQELPVKGTVGFELFNQSDMGLTDFAQKVNYQRALQGEIARTIMDMDGIAYARVHIALPERSLFRASRSEPRAAVTLAPQGGTIMDPSRIAGIQRLVAAAVPDLALDQVAILNEKGELLTPQFSQLAVGAPDNALEQDYADRALGSARSVAPRASLEVKATIVRRPVSPAAGPDPLAPLARDHSVRLVLFERTGLSAGEREAIRAAVTKDLGLDPSAGDEILFSPAPLTSPIFPAQASTPARAASSPDAAQEALMAPLTRSWTIAFSLLGALGLGFLAASIARKQRRTRAELASRIREHLLIVDRTVDAA